MLLKGIRRSLSKGNRASDAEDVCEQAGVDRHPNSSRSWPAIVCNEFAVARWVSLERVGQLFSCAGM